VPIELGNGEPSLIEAEQHNVVMPMQLIVLQML